MPNIGTSIEAFRLIWPVLGIPAVLSGQCFLFDYQFKAMHRFMLFLFGMKCRFFGGCYVLKLGWRTDLTYCAGGVRIFNAFPAQAVIYGRNHPCGDKHSDELDVPCYLQVFGLEVGCDASDCPSIIRVYDSERSKDAVTLRPRYNSLNQYSLRT